jgi:hypothetical protein
VVTLVFHASVSNQQFAYAASVLALLLGASFAAYLDVRHRLRGRRTRFFAQWPFGLITLVFLAMCGLIVVQHGSGLLIALAFVLVVVGTAFVSRWLRSTELRFGGFEFQDPDSQRRWEEIRHYEFQVLVPHDPTHLTLAEKEAEIRKRHRLGPKVPIIFVEVELGDPSDFYQKPLMKIEQPEGREVIRVSRCTSVAHVLACIGLAFTEVGEPPEIHFAWSDESPMTANLNFLLLGQGNVPWMVHALVRKAQPNPLRQPRVVIG